MTLLATGVQGFTSVLFLKNMHWMDRLDARHDDLVVNVDSRPMILANVNEFIQLLVCIKQAYPNDMPKRILDKDIHQWAWKLQKSVVVQRGFLLRTPVSKQDGLVNC